MIRFASFKKGNTGNTGNTGKKWPRPALFLALLLIAELGSACNGSNRNSGEPFEGEITSRTYIEGQPTEIRFSIKDKKARVENLLLPEDVDESIVLFDFSSDTATTLFPRTKAYTTINLNEMTEDLAEVTEENPTIDFSKATITGETETIAGVPCRHWRIGDTADICLANFGGGVLDKLKDFALHKKAKAQLEANPEFAKFADGGMFVLKVANIENGRSNTIMEVTSIDRKPLDDSLFTAPVDYIRAEAP